MGIDCADVDGNGLPGYLRHQLLRGAEHALPEPRRRHLRRCRRRKAGPRLRVSCRSDSARSCSTPTTTATSTSTSPTVTSSTTSSCISRTLTYAQKDLLYENLGGGKFRDVSAQGGPALQVDARRPRAGGRRLRQRRQSRRRHFERRASAPVLLRNQGARRRQLDHDPGEGQEEQRLRSGRDRARSRRRKDAGQGDQQRRQLPQQQRHPAALRPGRGEDHPADRDPVAERQRGRS